MVFSKAEQFPCLTGCRLGKGCQNWHLLRLALVWLKIVVYQLQFVCVCVKGPHLSLLLPFPNPKQGFDFGAFFLNFRQIFQFPSTRLKKIAEIQRPGQRR